jgi:hypothetical protein
MEKQLFNSVEGAGDPVKEEMQGCRHNLPPGTVYNAGTQVAARPLSTMDIIAQVSAMPPDSGDRVALMERLIKMKYDDEDRTAEKEFQSRFAEMQKELPAIKPDKEVKRRNGGKMYDYASLPYLKGIIDPIAQKHGFSYFWSQADSPDGKMRTIFHLCNCGHERQNFFQSEMLSPISSREGEAVTNVVQAARGTESYQKRATFIDGFGLTILGEDTDGKIEVDAELQSTLEKIKTATDLQKLMDVYQIAYKRYEANINQLKLVVGEYNLAKQAIARRPNNA